MLSRNKLNSFHFYSLVLTALTLMPFSISAQPVWVNGRTPPVPDAYQSCLNFYSSMRDPQAPNSPNLNSYENISIGRINSTRLYCAAIETWGWNNNIIIDRKKYYTLSLHSLPCTSKALINDPYTGACTHKHMTAKTKGRPQTPICGIAGNPINISNGNKFQTETDFTIKSSGAMTFKRHYNSSDGIWRHSFSSHMRLDSIFAYVILADGREIQFKKVKNTHTFMQSNEGTLTANGEYYKYTSINNESYIFDKDLMLHKQTDKFGETITLHREGFDLTIQNTNGVTFQLTEDALWQPIRFKSENLIIDYTYDSNQLTTVTKRYPSTISTRKYFYKDGPSKQPLLTSIIDERGIEFARWEYDNLGRAIKSEHANGAGRTLISYFGDGDSAEITNELGRVTKYEFINIDGTRHISAINGEPSLNCPSSNSTFTYTTGGQLSSHVNAEGILTEFKYNERGLEIRRTEASGTLAPRTTVTEWHPIHPLPTKVITTNKTTSYEYDERGRQTRKTITPNKLP